MDDAVQICVPGSMGAPPLSIMLNLKNPHRSVYYVSIGDKPLALFVGDQLNAGHYANVESMLLECAHTNTTECCTMRYTGVKEVLCSRGLQYEVEFRILQSSAGAFDARVQFFPLYLKNIT